MEKLEKKQGDTTIKISTATLTAKLALASLSEEDIKTLSREQLPENWAESVLAGKDVPVAVKSTSSNEVEWERRKQK